jgi:hypothetical protein
MVIYLLFFDNKIFRRESFADELPDNGIPERSGADVLSAQF